MFRIMEKRLLAPAVHQLVVEAPLVARRARPGNFVIVRTDETGERIPLTIADYDPETGTVMLVVQEVGKSTMDIGMMEAGDSFTDVAGPLGQATPIKKVGTIVGVAGGIGVAPLLPQIKLHKEIGNHVITIVGARTRDLLILKDETEQASHEVIFATDDGTFGYHGFVTGALEELIKQGRQIDEVTAIGPVRMMQATCNLTRKYNIPTLVSLNAVMVDGTGMCGCCRVTVGGETTFSCVDGPDFDGHKVDFDELASRQAFFRDEENLARELAEQKRGGCRCHEK